MQLGICGIGDILLLNGRIDEGNFIMFAIFLFVIDANTYLENEFYALFSNTFAKVLKFRRDARKRIATTQK